jgi:branched-subunit amino acid transport protein
MIMVFGMAAVTYLPRLFPFLMVSASKLPVKLRRFLQYIPYTALGALIIPGVFSSVPGHPFAVIGGIAFAILYSYFKGGIIIPVLGAVALTYVSLLVF